MSTIPPIGIFAFVQNEERQKLLTKAYQLIINQHLEFYFSEKDVKKILNSNVVYQFENSVITPIVDELGVTDKELQWTIKKMSQIFQNGWGFFFQNFKNEIDKKPGGTLF